MPTEQRRHGGRGRFSARSWKSRTRTTLQYAHWYGHQAGEWRTDWHDKHQELRANLGHLNFGVMNCRHADGCRHGTIQLRAQPFRGSADAALFRHGNEIVKPAEKGHGVARNVYWTAS
jgi:hypothetical protein